MQLAGFAPLGWPLAVLPEAGVWQFLIPAAYHCMPSIPLCWSSFQNGNQHPATCFANVCEARILKCLSAYTCFTCSSFLHWDWHFFQRCFNLFRDFGRLQIQRPHSHGNWRGKKTSCFGILVSHQTSYMTWTAGIIMC